MEQRRRQGKSHPADGGSSSSGGDSDGGCPSSPSAGQQEVPSSSGNAFANDGSFMEMFKKKMEEEMRKKAQGADGEQGHKKPPPVTSFVRGLADSTSKLTAIVIEIAKLANSQAVRVNFQDELKMHDNLNR